MKTLTVDTKTKVSAEELHEIINYSSAHKLDEMAKNAHHVYLSLFANGKRDGANVYMKNDRNPAHYNVVDWNQTSHAMFTRVGYIKF